MPIPAVACRVCGTAAAAATYRATRATSYAVIDDMSGSGLGRRQLAVGDLIRGDYLFAEDLARLVAAGDLEVA